MLMNNFLIITYIASLLIILFGGTLCASIKSFKFYKKKNSILRQSGTYIYVQLSRRLEWRVLVVVRSSLIKTDLQEWVISSCDHARVFLSLSQSQLLIVTASVMASVPRANLVIRRCINVGGFFRCDENARIKKYNYIMCI